MSLPPCTPYTPIILQYGNRRLQFLVKRVNNIRLETVYRTICPAHSDHMFEEKTLEASMNSACIYIINQINFFKNGIMTHGATSNFNP